MRMRVCGNTMGSCSWMAWHGLLFFVLCRDRDRDVKMNDIKNQIVNVNVTQM